MCYYQHTSGFFHFLVTAKCFDDCILRVWGLLVQFLDVKLDFVDHCVQVLESSDNVHNVFIPFL